VDEAMADFDQKLKPYEENQRELLALIQQCSGTV